jgi:hypothetical protein
MVTSQKILQDYLAYKGETEVKLRKMQQKLMDDNVKEVVYVQETPRTTFCILVMHDGWEVFGTSSCNSDHNYDKQHGKDLALLHALTRLKAKLENKIDKI